MDRSRTPSAQTLARASLASLLAGGVLLVVVSTVSTTATTGCSSVETVNPPDAAPPPCNRGPFTFFCQPPAADEPSCNTQNGTSPVLGRLPQNTPYPVGCVVNFVGPRDEQGDCRLDAVCKCVIGEVAVAPVEQDAGDDAEAGAQPQPGGVPIWLCDPP
jgi:hypothetical protein